MVPLHELEPSRRTSWPRRMLFLLPAIAFIALLAFGLFKAAPAELTPGAHAPDFELPLLDGSGLLSSDKLEGNLWCSTSGRRGASRARRRLLCWSERGASTATKA